jgi:mRNA interferase RelE/StbE
VYEIKFTPRARDDISAISAEILKGIKDKIDWLANNAEVIKHERLQAKKFVGVYSLHFGAYRVIYSLDRAEQLITIHRIGHHREVYRR